MTTEESATEWGFRGRQAAIDATAAIEAANFGTAKAFRELADECFEKEFRLRTAKSPNEPFAQNGLLKNKFHDFDDGPMSPKLSP